MAPRGYAAIISSGVFATPDHGAVGRHDGRRGDPRDVLCVLARDAIRGPDRGVGEGAPGRLAHVPSEYGRRPPTVLSRPGRAKGLRAVVPDRVRHVESVRGVARPSVGARGHVRDRDARGSGLPPRDVPKVGARERDGRGRALPLDGSRGPTARTERALPRRDLVEDGYERRLSGLHTGLAGRRGTRRRTISPGGRPRVD